MEFFTDVAVEAATIAGKHLLANFRAHRVAIYGENVLSISNRSLSKEITPQHHDRRVGLCGKRQPLYLDY